MSSVLFSEVLSCEDVPKVGAAVDALDFCSSSVGVRKPFYCAWDFVVKAWPATIRFKFVLRTIKFCAAAFANIGAFFPKRIVFSCKGHFGAFVNYNLMFFRGKLLEVGLFFRSRQ